MAAVAAAVPTPLHLQFIRERRQSTDVCDGNKERKSLNYSKEGSKFHET